MSSLSVLELYILVGALRLYRRRSPSEGVNFEMAWEEYAQLGRLRSHGDNYSKPAALRAWEQLLGCALLSYLDPRWEIISIREFPKNFHSEV